MAAGLITYIAEARSKKIPDDQIKKALIDAGWPQDQVSQAFSPVDSYPPVPPSPPAIAHVGMWTGFLYIIFFISLYILASSMAGIFHGWVDQLIPSPDSSTSSFYAIFSTSTIIIRGYLAALIVSYPIFITLALVLKKQITHQPEIRNIRSRKILIYITLVGTFLIILGHIITYIYGFLSGDVTTNTLGHLLVTLFIAGSIFGYFLNEVKNDRKNK